VANPFRRGLSLFAISCSIFVSVATTRAQLTNGGFESGLTGWSSDGTASAAGTTGGQPPLEGSLQAVIDTPQSGTASQSSLETFLELPASSLDAIRDGFNTAGGSAIKQIFNVQNGDTIQFLWDFLPNGSTTNSTQNDTGFFTLHLQGSNGAPVTLSDTTTSGGNPTGYHSFQSGPLTAGSWLLGFAAFDSVGTGGNALRPTLLIDNVQIIAAIPEPATWLLLLCGIPMVLIFRRRRVA
jgi:hypothetical protein